MSQIRRRQPGLGALLFIASGAAMLAVAVLAGYDIIKDPKGEVLPQAILSGALSLLLGLYLKRLQRSSRIS